MNENRVVNALIEALDNEPGEKREPIQVSRLLVYCQQRCPEWFKSCERYEQKEWISLMIRPEKKCPMVESGPF